MNETVNDDHVGSLPFFPNCLTRQLAGIQCAPPRNTFDSCYLLSLPQPYMKSYTILQVSYKHGFCYIARQRHAQTAYG